MSVTASQLYSDRLQRQMQMSNRRQEDYDGQLNYEYIKVPSSAVSSASTVPVSSSRKLRPRDHRLLATWSYFFSPAKLFRCHLPWSQFAHLDLIDGATRNGRALPECLERSVVALCSSQNIAQAAS